ncbi:haloacid dehalogenase-like protein [Phanerochaete sordida]|uniref:Haloacid dehalogenase-like protein n=1 Tax=Phanerochaete sordida TaxID=48140 RepID=A0A9P3LKE2_9APHY|nr:haloacid dehalogenase-like protein [Phanerochaete sordida]
MSSSKPKHVLAFDIYGTILDTSSIAAALQPLLAVDAATAAQLSQLWRRYQLEYTWRLNSMGTYEPFDVVTRRALEHALAEHGLAPDARTLAHAMAAYSRLPAFADAAPALHALAALPHVEVVVFSNGTEEMVTAALAAGALAPRARRMFLADAVRTYKPARALYDALVRFVNSDGAEDDVPADRVWLVSGNPFDVTGARSAGLQAIWVDRPGRGWVDRASTFEPSTVVRGLGEIVDFVRSL